MTAPETDIDEALVRALIRTQCPQWAHLPITRVEDGGWDNRTFRLGDDLVVRLPSAARYVPQVAKEQRWLPRLAPFLPLPIPHPVARGIPAAGYPWPWSVYRWIKGETAAKGQIDDVDEFASTLAKFLHRLQAIDVSGGPAPGPHNFFRGGPVATYDTQTREAIHSLDDPIDRRAATATWHAAIEAPWHGPPVWCHGDVSATNLLVEDGCLRAVIDFGSLGVGDPACDLTIAWTLFTRESRRVFREALPVDDGAWARGRGWALWKGLITLAESVETHPVRADGARRLIEEILADHGV